MKHSCLNSSTFSTFYKGNCIVGIHLYLISFAQNMTVRLIHAIVCGYSSFSLLYSIHCVKCHHLSILWWLWIFTLFLAWNYCKIFPINLCVHFSWCTYAHISLAYIPRKWLLDHKVCVCSGRLFQTIFLHDCINLYS